MNNNLDTFDTVEANRDFLIATVALAEIMEEEGMNDNPEEKEDFLDLFPEYESMFQSFYGVLTGIDTKSPPVYDDAICIEHEHAKRSCNKMTRLDAENICRFIAEKCKGRSDIAGIIDDVFDYINGKFSKLTIKNLINGKTYSDISMRFFKIDGRVVKL